MKKNDEEIKHRIITLGDINEENSNDIIHFIHEINYIDNNKNINKREPISLIINSYGGDTYRGLGIIDTIMNSITPVHTICYGAAMSMGFIIMAVGHYRTASINSTFMYHEGSLDLGTIKLTNHKYELHELERIENICDSLLFKHTSLTKKYLKSIKSKNKDWYMNAEEALEYGIIDKIILK